jgi:hypothetical protein
VLGMIREIDIWSVALLMVKHYAEDAEAKMPTAVWTSLRPREIKLVRPSGVGLHLRSKS